MAYNNIPALCPSRCLRTWYRRLIYLLILRYLKVSRDPMRRVYPVPDSTYTFCDIFPFSTIDS